MSWLLRSFCRYWLSVFWRLFSDCCFSLMSCLLCSFCRYRISVLWRLFSDRCFSLVSRFLCSFCRYRIIVLWKFIHQCFYFISTFCFKRFILLHQLLFLNMSSSYIRYIPLYFSSLLIMKICKIYLGFIF